MNLDTLKVLQSFGCKLVDDSGICSLLYVATGLNGGNYGWNEDMVRFLLENGADINYCDGWLLNEAFRLDDYETAFKLYKLGARLNLLDSDNQMSIELFRKFVDLVDAADNAYKRGFKDGYRTASKENDKSTQ